MKKKMFNLKRKSWLKLKRYHNQQQKARSRRKHQPNIN